MKIMVTSFRRPHACTATLSDPNPVVGQCWPTPLPETAGYSHACVGQSLVGSLLLSPGSWCTQGFVCALQESVPQSCVSSGGSAVGLVVTSSKRAYGRLRSGAPRAPVPVAAPCRPVLLQETLKHRSASDSKWSLGPAAHKVCFSALRVSGGYGAWF